jgi:hypothetical protein
MAEEVRPDRLRVSIGVTKNLGDFNSARVDASLESDVKPGETLDEAWTRLWTEVDTQVEAELDSRD